MIAARPTAEARETLVEQAVAGALPRFDAASREYAYHRNQEMLRESRRDLADARSIPSDPARGAAVPLWRGHVEQLDAELLDAGRAVFTRLVIEQLLDRATIIDAGRRGSSRGVGRGSATRRSRRRRGRTVRRRRRPSPRRRGPASSPLLEPQPVLDAIQAELSRRFGRRLLLWQVERDELVGVRRRARPRPSQMPGWTNVWTMPIQNRVDMLATGVNTPIGIRVLGPEPRRRGPRLGGGRRGS